MVAVHGDQGPSFASIFDHAPVPMFVCDGQGRNCYVNRGYSTLVGQPPHALLDDRWQALLPDAARSTYVSEFVARLALGDRFTMDLEVPHADGRSRVWEVTVSPLPHDESGTHWLGVLRNVSRERAALADAPRFARRYENMIEELPVVFMATDPASTVTVVDAAVTQAPKAQQWLGRNLLELLEDQPAACAAIRSVLATGRPETRRVAYRDRIYQMNWYATHDDDGVITGLESISFDITERVAFDQHLRRAFDGLIGVVAQLTDLADPYTQGHEETVADLAEVIARRLDVDEQSIEGLRVAARLHDTGKIAVPPILLARPGKLSSVEFELIKTHVENARQIFSGVSFPWPEIEAVYEHHERLDGSGYPLGLKGDEISLPGRILAVADVCDAMTSHRPYRPARSQAELLDELRTNRGVLYDETVVDAAVELIESGEMPFRQTLGEDRHGPVLREAE
jgi:PAS domain S-box-containing protein